MLLGVIALAAFGISTRTGGVFVDALTLYFACESTTPGNCEASKNTAEQNTYPGLAYTAYILLALFPLVNLVYAFNFNELKEIWLTQFKQKWFSSASFTKESTLDRKELSTKL